MRLVACEYRLDDLWRQKRHAHHAADVGWVDVLGIGDFIKTGEAVIPASPAGKSQGSSAGPHAVPRKITWGPRNLKFIDFAGAG
jgi:hypothetical protein